MRFIAPVAIVVALVGGYVVGQELAPQRGAPLPETFRPAEDPAAQRGRASAALRRKRADLLEKFSEQVGNLEIASDAPAVGRYLPFGTDRLLDSATGTLYRMEGAHWMETVTMRAKAAAKPPADPTEGLDLDELLGK
ncbi:MAG: hypothetical protein U0836_05600 [Pirellulales bacterium]